MSEVLLCQSPEEQDVPGVPGLTLDYRLRWMDFDRYGHINPASVLDIFQDVATLQAEQQGIGYDDMQKKGVFWVVVRSKFQIVRQPEHYQKVLVRTWPHTPSRFSFMRDFTMRDDEGNLLVKATSEWVFMSVETRKFVRITDIYDGTYDLDETRSFKEKPRKLPDFACDPEDGTVLVPRYSFIDHNGHVNNAMYANLVIDAMDPRPEGKLQTFQIDYRHEVLPNAPVRIHTQKNGNGVFAKGVNEEGAVAFACQMDFCIEPQSEDACFLA